MIVLTFASRKGGSGKSTLAAHLSCFAHRTARRCVLIDADPQGSLTHWHGLRGEDGPQLKIAGRSITQALASAAASGAEYAFIDTPPTMSAAISDAIAAATLVIVPARPSVFDIAAVKETVELSQRLKKPYAVVINGAPPQREGCASPLVVRARAELEKDGIPVWGGQITNRADYVLALNAGEGVREYAADGLAAQEMARLWSAVDKSARMIENHGRGSSGIHKRAA